MILLEYSLNSFMPKHDLIQVYMLYYYEVISDQAATTSWKEFVTVFQNLS